MDRIYVVKHLYHLSLYFQMKTPLLMSYKFSVWYQTNGDNKFVFWRYINFWPDYVVLLKMYPVTKLCKCFKTKLGIVLLSSYRTLCDNSANSSTKTDNKEARTWYTLQAFLLKKWCPLCVIYQVGPCEWSQR